jgi:glycosyltransferase involved in cell wall biosynthesis
MAPTLWIDVTELFGHFALTSHHTGVSRVVIHLADELTAMPGAFGRAQPIFWHPVRRSPLTCGPEIAPLAQFFPSLREIYRRSGSPFPQIRSRLVKGLITSVPKPFRYRLVPSAHGVTHFVRWAEQRGLSLSEATFGRGDCVFVPGSFWLGGYAPGLAAKAGAREATVAAFVYDVLLLSNPEWLPPGHADQFRRGLAAFLPRCQAIACGSAFTRSELLRHVDIAADVAVEVCRLADRLEYRGAVALPREIASLRGPYVLFVSTMTPRKNHRLLVEAWVALWERHRDRTPSLVFVGGGGPDEPLAAALERARAAGDRVIRLADIDDGALDALYRHAWLTAYPSLGEGYGLPVAEALGKGKICLSSDRGGLREIAPGLVDPIDPDDFRSVVAQVSRYLDDPNAVAAREGEIRSRFRSTGWADTAAAVRMLLEKAGSTR